MSHRNQRQKDTCYPKILSPQKKKQTLETKWHFSEEKKEKRKKKTWGLVGNKSSSQTLEEDPQQSKKDEATFFFWPSFVPVFPNFTESASGRKVFLAALLKCLEIIQTSIHPGACHFSTCKHIPLDKSLLHKSYHHFQTSFLHFKEHTVLHMRI